MDKIKIGILGYGNLGKGVEKAVGWQPDMELVGIYSRRKLGHPLAKSPEILRMGEPVDVLILCGGSATDLPAQTPEFAGLYHIVDSYDHHQQIAAHYEKVDAAAREGGKLGLISCGWDPGLFSMMRAIFSAVLPGGEVFTFWGKGISQGHSDAIRRIKGVKDARQYTIPREDVIEKVKEGSYKEAEMTATKIHRRECFVVAEDKADLQNIEIQIKAMPDYFEDYETTVHFISQERLENDHSGFPHGGMVLGVSGTEHEKSIGSLQLELSSNPDFTAGILVGYARAIYRMAQEGETGCRTVLDIPIGKLCKDIFQMI